MIKFQALIIIASLALTLFTFIDCAQRDQTQLRNLPKWAWLLIIFFFTTIGPIAYLIAGRPRGNGPKPKGGKRVLPPDDDPDFLRKL